MLKLKIVKWQGCVLWGKKGQEGNVQQRARQGRCDVDPTAEMLAVLVTGGKEGVGLGAGLAARVGHPSLSCLRSGFLFGELADDTNERSVLVLQPLIVRLQLRQNLRKDKDEAGLQLGGMAKKPCSSEENQPERRGQLGSCPAPTCSSPPGAPAPAVLSTAGWPRVLRGGCRTRSTAKPPREAVPQPLPSVSTRLGEQEPFLSYFSPNLLPKVN